MAGSTRCRHCVRMCWHGSPRTRPTGRITASLHHFIMRTTLDIDDDLLAEAKELARRGNTTAGQIVSRLLRESLTGGGRVAVAPRKASRRTVAGFVPFPARQDVVTSNDTVNALRDAEGV